MSIKETNPQMIDYVLTAERKGMRLEYENIPEKIENDRILLEFRYEAEKLLIDLRAKYEAKLNN